MKVKWHEIIQLLDYYVKYVKYKNTLTIDIPISNVMNTVTMNAPTKNTSTMNASIMNVPTMNAATMNATSMNLFTNYNETMKT